MTEKAKWTAQARLGGRFAVMAPCNPKASPPHDITPRDIANDLTEEDAALIVRAVNAHDAMLDALTNIAANLGNPLDNPRARWEDSLRRCAEAIALANGGV